jgi:predicted GH43/DUF377 family glycosyl hydrolase
MDPAYFDRAVGFTEASRLRRMETRDIVERLGVLSPNRVFLNNYPIRNPIAIFNASLAAVGDDEVSVFARIVIGYYMYVSAIVRLTIPISDLLSKAVSANYYAATLTITPSTRYDIWGTEDPRVYVLNGRLYMTYTGRTVNYFDPVRRRERTLPVTAVAENGQGTKWRKRYVHVLPKHLRDKLISDKDAFMVEASGVTWLFHRPHMADDVFYMVVSRTTLPQGSKAEDVEEVEARDTLWVLPSAPFEEKVGWSAPPIRLGPDTVVVLAHGVDREIHAYRMFAVKLRLSRTEGPIVEAVTPYYIMEPKQSCEVFGDRPFTIFPCGAWLINRRNVLVSYGAADYMVGFGLIDLDELLAHLDKGRIY